MSKWQHFSDGLTRFIDRLTSPRMMRLVLLIYLGWFLAWLTHDAEVRIYQETMTTSGDPVSLSAFTEGVIRSMKENGYCR